MISIHAPLAGCDQKQEVKENKSKISIHAPLAGCDLSSYSPVYYSDYFNPRTPCGVRLTGILFLLIFIVFQSTHPLRGATQLLCGLLCLLLFQSTHPLRGATIVIALITISLGIFQSTHPLRGATAQTGVKCILIFISIHAPLAGCDKLKRV